MENNSCREAEKFLNTYFDEPDRSDNRASAIIRGLLRDYNKLLSCVEVLPDDAEPQVGDLVTNLGFRAYRINRIEDGYWYSIEQNGELRGKLADADILIRNGKPCIYQSQLNTVKG